MSTLGTSHRRSPYNLDQIQGSTYTDVVYEVEFTDEFGTWFRSLSEPEQAAVEARVDLLMQEGPTLRRPVVGEITGSRFDPAMKELRVGSLRVLFIFDPRSTAILLVGGDKAEAGWKAWYPKAIPDADQLYEEYLEELRAEGLLPPRE
jgi:hypothetical protein